MQDWWIVVVVVVVAAAAPSIGVLDAVEEGICLYNEENQVQTATYRAGRVDCKGVSRAEQGKAEEREREGEEE